MSKQIREDLPSAGLLDQEKVISMRREIDKSAPKFKPIPPPTSV